MRTLYNKFSFTTVSFANMYSHSDNTYIEVLDSTRVHPETYEWARKMAVDALEYDEVSTVSLQWSSMNFFTLANIFVMQ